MAGLVPAIHVSALGTKGVDARHKAGHDELSVGLLARGAGVHIDFHADGNFDDLWSLPGHCFLAWF
jgi:hypothetical protein